MLSTRRVAVLALFAAASANGDFTLHHWEDHFEPVHQISLEGDFLYYNTTQNYNQNAVEIAPPGLNSYKRYDVDLTGQFGLVDQFSIFGRATWTHIAVDQTSGTNSTSGFADQTLGADFRVFETPLQRQQWVPYSLDLQLQADFPAYGARGSDPNTLILGDHSLDVTPGGFFNAAIWQDTEEATVFSGGVGYTFRSGHFSPQVPWTLSMGLEQKSKGLLLSASVFGTASLQKDTSTVSGTATGSGGSLITNGINSELIILRAKAGYQFGPDSQLLIAYERSVWGQNAPAGSSVWLGYRATLIPDKTSNLYPKSNSGLQQYNLDAKVTKVNDRLNRVEIDKGFDEGVEKGQIFDLFRSSPDGEAIEAVARAQVSSVKSSEAALTVVEYFKEVYVNEGFVAKRLVR